MGDAARSQTVKRRKGSPHDRTGCLTCRYRHKKCIENTFPVCGSCKRLNIKCVRDPVRNVVPTAKSKADCTQRSKSPSPGINLDRQLGFPSPVMGTDKARSSEHRYAMKYYISELANHFAVSKQYNSFLSDFLPMALESPALFDSLLALASSHISLVDNSYAIATLEAQSNAIKHLSSAISTPSNDMIWHETNAATCLALATSLISTSDGKGWYSHLQGAKYFVTAAKASSTTGKDLRGIDAFKLTAEGRWILRNFAYHDIIGSVTLRRRPLLDASYLSDICQVVDSYLGVATPLLSYISQISFLESTTRMVEDLNISAADAMVLFDLRCIQIESELQSWTCHSEMEGDLSSMAYAYRSCALILLYRLIRKQLKSNHATYMVSLNPTAQKEVLEAKIAIEVANTLEHVSGVPVGGAPEAALLFPLFIAGGETTDELQINMIRERLQQNLAKRNFQNISRSLEILESLWTSRQLFGVDSTDWVEILDASGEELVLT